MKHVFLSLALLFSGTAMAKEKVIPPNWQPVHEIKVSDMKAYYDANGFISLNETARAGILMVVYSKPTKIKIGDKEITVRSYVRAFIVECKKNLSAPVSDLYFLEEFPTLTSRPLAGFEYNDGVGIQPVTPSSIIHRLFCAPQI
jgi:hypothetical protein